MPLIQNGMTPTQAWPSYRSNSSSLGTSGRIWPGERGQWAKSRSCQFCSMIHGRDGMGVVRWAVWWSSGCTLWLLGHEAPDQAECFIFAGEVVQREIAVAAEAVQAVQLKVLFKSGQAEETLKGGFLHLHHVAKAHVIG